MSDTMMKNGTVNLSEFDFSIPLTIKHGGGGRNPNYDGYAVISNKGRNRKTFQRGFSISSFFTRTGKKYDWIAIGRHNSKKQNIAVFDMPRIDGATKINNYQNEKAGSKQAIIGNGSFVYKLFNIFGIEIPAAAGASIKFMFNLVQADQEHDNVFIIVPLAVSTIDGNGKQETKTFKRREEERFEKKLQSDYDFS